MTLDPLPWLEDEPDWFEDELFDEADPLEVDESSEDELFDEADPLEVDESSEEEPSDQEFDESSEDELPVLLLEVVCWAALLVVVLPR